MMKKVYIVSLGCPKNLVDSEVMLGLLDQAGYAVAEEPAAADLLLVNTCGFISSAVEEAIDEILELARHKQQDPAKLLVVTGCLVKRYGAALRDELPEVDLFVSTEDIQNIIQLLAPATRSGPGHLALSAEPFLMDSSLPRKISTPSHRAYLKITEGCANRCTYCLIPSIRGRLRSRPIDDLVEETARLAAAGVRELTLVAQDLLAYGLDRGRAELPQLLTAILDNSEIPWIRLLYLHPARLDRGFLRFLAGHPRILPYLDIPLQHVSDRILRLMGRPYDRNRIEQLLTEARELLPGCAIRTTLMTGFPGETTEDFARMRDFVRDHGFDHVGVFAYSNEEGAPAAGLPDHCDEQVKEERRRTIMELQAEISGKKLQEYVGREVKVLVEGISEETELLLAGRAWFQAPGIDGCVYIAAGESRPGAIVRVRITDSHYYDLVGEIVEGDEKMSL
jgi:ribosomal protein S12 methylthiotransferase